MAPQLAGEVESASTHTDHLHTHILMGVQYVVHELGFDTQPASQKQNSGTITACDIRIPSNKTPTSGFHYLLQTGDRSSPLRMYRTRPSPS